MNNGKADEHIVNAAHGKLVQIAEQINMLKHQAQEILKKANDDQILAHASCNFEKKVGQNYYLYRFEYNSENKRKYSNILENIRKS